MCVDLKSLLGIEHPLIVAPMAGGPSSSELVVAASAAGASTAYRAALLTSQERDTRLTRAFSGRLARGLVNRFMDDLDSNPDSILPFPVQNKFTRDIREACAKAGLVDGLSLWAGMGQGELFQGSARDLIANLFREQG